MTPPALLPTHPADALDVLALVSPLPALPTAPGLAQPVARSDRWVTRATEDLHERVAAFRLVHDAYCQSGLMTPQASGMRVMKHHLSGHADVLVTLRNGEVMLTSTLVRDGQMGLPMESLFAPEVASMRAQGLRVAEFSCLTSCPTLVDRKQRFDLLIDIIGLTFQVARHHGVDQVIMAVHPRHAKVYQRLFGCFVGSEVRQYDAVEGNPAVLCVHDFATADRDGYLVYEKIYRPQYTTRELEGVGMSEAERSGLLSASSADSCQVIAIAA